jgi:hypothetical protein
MDPRRTSDPPRSEEERLLLHCLFAAARACRIEESVISLLPYLECFPLGVFNRHVAQRIEDLLTERGLEPRVRADLVSRFRGLRDPFMPTLEVIS